MTRSAGVRSTISPLLCAMLTALVWPRETYAALPPASTGASSKAPEAASSSAAAPRSAQPAKPNESADSAIWALPVIRMGGNLSYDIRTYKGDDGQKSIEQGGLATLRAGADTFLWQPWFAQVSGTLNLTAMRNSSETDTAFSGGTTKNIVWTGTGQLRLLPVSRFPFELHFDKSDTRVINELVPVEGYSSERVGFSQQYFYRDGNVMVGWDRATQESESNGRDRNDNWRLTATRSLGQHRFTMSGDRSHSERGRTNESATQNNLTVQHGYAPVSSTVSVENMANISHAGFKLQGASSETDLAQLTSLLFWRPSAKPLTVTGGARFLIANAESGSNTSSFNSRLRNANANVGLAYELSRSTYVNASANVNVFETNGESNVGSTQSAGIGYRPDGIKLGEFRYNWGTSATLLNTVVQDGDGMTQLGGQLGHSLSRGFTINPGSSLSFDLNQSFSAVKPLAASSGEDGNSINVSHGASASWMYSQGAGSAMLRLSVSDSRSVESSQNFFQMINFQASSNLSTSTQTSWSGNLTIQGTRQGGNDVLSTLRRNGERNQGFGTSDKFVMTSGGGVTYQNGRFFGVRRLRFTSEVRLNSDALFPMFGGVEDQEMAVWQNRLDYSIGRTQLRVNTLIARIKQPIGGGSEFGAPQAGESETSTNKAILFSVMREFGNF